MPNRKHCGSKPAKPGIGNLEFAIEFENLVIWKFGIWEFCGGLKRFSVINTLDL
jgi:hypothetical protein